MTDGRSVFLKCYIKSPKKKKKGEQVARFLKRRVDRFQKNSSVSRRKLTLKWLWKLSVFEDDGADQGHDVEWQTSPAGQDFHPNRSSLVRDVAVVGVRPVTQITHNVNKPLHDCLFHSQTTAEPRFSSVIRPNTIGEIHRQLFPHESM